MLWVLEYSIAEIKFIELNIVRRQGSGYYGSVKREESVLYRSMEGSVTKKVNMQYMVDQLEKKDRLIPSLTLKGYVSVSSVMERVNINIIMGEIGKE